MAVQVAEPVESLEATPHALAEYAPAPKQSRRGIGLCLSGGGYRATLFHLGALQRLQELGVLAQVSTIASVSGGSITAAHLATALKRLGKSLQHVAPDEWATWVVRPLEAFTRRDIRTGAILKRLLPWNWLRSSTGAEALAERYESLTSLMMGELPVLPRFVLCSTDLAWGVNWIFERERLGDFQAGYSHATTDWPLARAVAASSCFPPVFNPLPVNLSPVSLTGGKASPGHERDACIRGLRLSDGGVYDNLGLEPVWKDHAVVLVSDGGALFHPEPDRNLLWRLGRYVAVQDHQAHALRTRWLVSNFMSGEMSGTYWSIGGARTSYQTDGGYSKPLAESVIAGIRTDLDGFSEAESAILQNHGYLLADAALQRHVPSLLPSPVPPLTPPYPGWLPPMADEDEVREALKDSGKRKLFGRG